MKREFGVKRYKAVGNDGSIPALYLIAVTAVKAINAGDFHSLDMGMGKIIAVLKTAGYVINSDPANISSSPASQSCAGTTESQGAPCLIGPGAGSPETDK